MRILVALLVVCYGCLEVSAPSTEGFLVFGECDSAGHSQIVTYDLHTDTRVQLTNGTDMKWFPAWSPDGRQIAYVDEPASSNLMQIWIMNADGSHNRPLVMGGFNIAPAWSPDGTQIACAHSETGGQPLRLWSIGLADAVPHHLLPDALSNATVDENVPRWSRDGRQIAFTSNRRAGRYEIWVFDVQQPATLHPLTVAYHDERLNANIEQKVPAWSPDSTHIAYWQGVEGSDPRTDLPRDVWVMRADGSDPQRLTRGDDPNWSPDGTLISHSLPPLGPGIMPAIAAVQPDGGGERVLLEVQVCRPLQSDWTNGG